MMSEPVVKLQGVTRIFRDFWLRPVVRAVDSLDLEVKKGEVFGTMTPLKGLTFIYRDIFLNRANDPEIWYEFIEWSDNPYLSKKEIKKEGTKSLMRYVPTRYREPP